MTGNVVSSPVQLPTHVWLRVIDNLQHDWPALLACSKVCRNWNNRTQLYLPRSFEGGVDLCDEEDLSGLAQVAHATRRLAMIRTIHLYGHRVSGSLSHLGLLVDMNSDKFPSLQELRLLCGYWDLKNLDTRLLFRGLPAFTSIVRLHLERLTIPSTTIFVQLLTTLGNLHHLGCTDATILDEDCNLSALPTTGLCKLNSVTLDCLDDDYVYRLCAALRLAASCRIVEIAVAHDPSDIAYEGYMQVVRTLPSSLTSLTIVMHDVNVSKELIGR